MDAIVFFCEDNRPVYNLGEAGPKSVSQRHCSHRASRVLPPIPMASFYPMTCVISTSWLWQVIVDP
jgi:hypothetical protein